MKKLTTLFASIIWTFTLYAQISWLQKGSDINGQAASDVFGYSTSLSSDGGTIAVGAYLSDANGAESGQVRVYNWNGSAWIQKGTEINGEAAGDQFGLSVSISADGNTLVAGAYYNDGGGSNSGHARVYFWNGTSWLQKGADINGEAANDYAGWSVSISASGNDIILGSWGNDTQLNSFVGQVEIYSWSGSAWIQKGSDIEGESGGNHFGFSVSMSADGNTIAAGARHNDGATGPSTSAGHVRVYNWNGSNWVQKGLDVNGVVPIGYFGWSVDLSGDGNTLIAGAPGEVGTSYGGNAYVYSWAGSAWVLKGSAIPGEAAGDLCGYSVSANIDGNIIAVGGRQNSGNYTASGNARMYEWSGTAWVQMGNDIDGDLAVDRLGTSLALNADGHIVAVGVPGSDVTATDAGQAKVFRTCMQTASTAVVSACNNYTWINGMTYTASNSTDTYILTNGDGCDSVLSLNLTIHNNSSGLHTVTACGSYLWMDGNTYSSSNNAATYTLVNENGCDSVVTLDLTINPLPDMAVSQTGNVLTVADTTAAFYQWGNCNTQTPIDSANSVSYTVTVDGSYAVFAMNSSGCADTSLCIDVTGLGIESSFENSIQISPNPFSDQINIDFSNTDIVNEVTIELYNVAGALLKKEHVAARSYSLHLSECPSGMYLLQIKDGQKVYHQTLIKE